MPTPGLVPIAPAPTSIAAFLGAGDGEPALVTSAGEAVRRWPGDSALATAVAGFFQNGGQLAWGVPVTDLTSTLVHAATETLHPDVTLVAVVADEPAAPAVISAAAAGLSGRRALLLVEGPWPDTAAATSAMAAGAETALGAAGPDVVAYWPRLRPAPGGAPTSPLGHVAGVIARTDRLRGVFRAPAGTDASILGVTEPVVQPSAAELDALGRFGVNVIRTLPDGRVVIWGARTLATPDQRTACPEWTYVAARRLALFIEETIERGLAWTIAEPNDEPLWAAANRSVETFLYALDREGAFPGQSPPESFFVRCDGSTMTEADLEDGRLVVLVGIAPVKPAEFLTLRIEVAALPAGER